MNVPDSANREVTKDCGQDTFSFKGRSFRVQKYNF